jgi:hypothetical protein
MGKYLDIIDRAEAKREMHDINDINDKTHSSSCIDPTERNRQSEFGRISRFGRTLSELERRCPAYVKSDRW